MYTVVKKTGFDEEENKPVYDLYVQEDGVDSLPSQEDVSTYITDKRKVLNVESKSETDYWPPGPWNGRRGLRGEVHYV